MRLAAALLIGTLSTSLHADEATDAARATAMELIQRLGAALKKELAASGPEGAITVCRDIAPALAGELSRRTGARVARVSLRTRNPLLGQADAWEQQVLLDFDGSAKGGTKPEMLERSEIVQEPQGRYFRYMKALPVQPLCLTCHGTSETIPDAVRTKIATEYPNDRATGYAPGQIRGAVSIKQPIGGEK